MTREEIVEGLKLLEDNMVHFDELQNDKGEWIDVHELLFEAIQALSQEPCDDAISREDVLAEITRFSTEEGASVECQQLYCDVNNMPSVTQKSGKWEFHCQHWSKCSICGYADKFADKWNYCPNCGAKMENVEKSLIDINAESGDKK